MLFFSRYTWWVGAMIGLALLLTAASQVGALGPVQGVFLTIVSPIEGGLNAVFRPVATFLTDADELSDLQRENRALRLENERLSVELTEAEADHERLIELEALLNLSGTVKDQQRVPANVVTRTSLPFQEELSIDRGSDDGIKVGMVVVSAQGSLVGAVIAVTGNQAFVRVITDGKSTVRVETLETKSDGVVKGTVDHQLVLDLAGPDVKVGDLVQTSAISGRFLAGIPIGRVSEVSGSPQDLSPSVKIEPLVRLSTVRTVQVITSFVPQEVTGR